MRSDALTVFDGMRNSTPEERESMERYVEGRIVELVPKDQYDRLLDLALDLYGFTVDVDALGWQFMCGCTDFCNHEEVDDGCTKTGVCWYMRKFRELGVVVDD